VKRIIAPIVLALAGLVTTGVGTANADEIQVEGSYSTQAACMVDGPHVEIVQGGTWTHFSCVQHADGLWYLYLSN
jgi:hypothetical protein